MSLRLRLTLLYTSLLGGVLLIFGSLVYSLVDVLLLDQVDSSLTLAANELTDRLRVNAAYRFDSRSLSDFQFAENLMLQVWDADQTLQISHPPGLFTPLDEQGRMSGVPVFRSAPGNNSARVRVLSVPLATARGPVGTLQVGINLAIIDAALSILSTVLVVLSIVVMLISGLATWLITRQALAPLQSVTQVATQITRADDLQRRIPFEGQGNDEVGQLIQAFNQTLERLENLFNAQRRFLADVSHELRTPLTVIKGNIGLMRRFGNLDEESLEGIETEVDRLTRLVSDLLLLAQAESSRLPLLVTNIDLDTLVLEAFQQMHTLAGERINLRLLEIDQIQVRGDRDRLKQVLVNLIGNAINYSPAGSQVTMALTKAGDHARIEVSDTGPGIPQEDLPHIFERFYRGEKSRRRTVGSGFGLGLSIVYWIVQNHQGTIEVRSTEGQGTTFIILLPAVQVFPDNPES